MTSDSKARIRRVCLVCGHDGTTYETKGKHKDINPCPKCKGSFVDVWVKHKYEQQSQQPLLTIELQDETSAPKVLYNGEEIPNKVNVSFNWETGTEYMGGLSYAIEHFEKENYIVSNRIERKVKGHAVD